MVQFLIKYGWCIYFGISMAAIGHGWRDWKFYAVMVPTLILVNIYKNSQGGPK